MNQMKLLVFQAAAKELGKGSQLLTGISCMDIVTVTVGKAFLDKVAAVAGGVDDSI